MKRTKLIQFSFFLLALTAGCARYNYVEKNDRTMDEAQKEEIKVDRNVLDEEQIELTD